MAQLALQSYVLSKPPVCFKYRAKALHSHLSGNKTLDPKGKVLGTFSSGAESQFISATSSSSPASCTCQAAETFALSWRCQQNYRPSQRLLQRVPLNPSEVPPNPSFFLSHPIVSPGMVSRFLQHAGSGLRVWRAPDLFMCSYRQHCFSTCIQTWRSAKMQRSPMRHPCPFWLCCSQVCYLPWLTGAWSHLYFCLLPHINYICHFMPRPTCFSCIQTKKDSLYCDHTSHWPLVTLPCKDEANVILWWQHNQSIVFQQADDFCKQLVTFLSTEYNVSTLYSHFFKAH